MNIYNSTFKNIIMESEETLGQNNEYFILSGTEEHSYFNTDHPFVNKTGERTNTFDILFERPFKSIPVVQAFITGFDFKNDRNQRITLKVVDITKKGFRVLVKVWADTILYRINFNWLALPPSLPSIKITAKENNEVKDEKKIFTILNSLKVDPLFFENDNHYLRLFKTGSSDNFSSYTVPKNKPWSPEDSDVKTVWIALRVDLNKMMIHTGDFTYAKSDGQCSHHPQNKNSVPYGSAFGCSNSIDAFAKIDLTGTPFAIDDTFTCGGYLPQGEAKFSSNDQIVEISGGGHCGWEVPTKANEKGENHACVGGWDIKFKIIDEISDIFHFSSNGKCYLNLKNENNFSSYKVANLSFI